MIEQFCLTNGSTLTGSTIPVRVDPRIMAVKGWVGFLCLMALQPL